MIVGDRVDNAHATRTIFRSRYYLLAVVLDDLYVCGHFVRLRHVFFHDGLLLVRCQLIRCDLEIINAEQNVASSSTRQVKNLNGFPTAHVLYMLLDMTCVPVFFVDHPYAVDRMMTYICESACRAAASSVPLVTFLRSTISRFGGGLIPSERRVPINVGISYESYAVESQLTTQRRIISPS